MTEFRIAVLPGDGIGPDVIAEAVKVLRSVEVRLHGVQFSLTEHAVGAAEYLRSGDPLPESAFEACRNSQAVLLGAMGLPEVRWPNGKEMTPQIDLRERLDLYAGVRPIRLAHAADSPLKKYGAGEIDFVIVRESTEGLFQPGESLLLHTGWSRHVDDPAVYRDGLPRISERLARWCVERRVKLLGVEAPSIADVNHLEEVTRIHRILLAGGVTIVEGLMNLDQITQPKVLFVALPLKIADGDGCPCRALAIESNAADGSIVFSLDPLAPESQA